GKALRRRGRHLGRDRRGARGERRGVRPVVRAEGRPVAPDGRGARRFAVGGRAGACRVLSRSGVAVGSDEYARYDYGRRSALGSYFDGSQPGPFGGDPRASGRGQGASGGTPSGFLGLQTSSFTDFLASHSPGLLPGRVVPAAPADPGVPGQAIRDLPHATTIVAAICDEGVVLAGDRRATAGNMISKRDVEKVVRSDEFSGMGYAGTGSVGIEF